MIFSFVCKTFYGIIFDLFQKKLFRNRKLYQDVIWSSFEGSIHIQGILHLTSRNILNTQPPPVEIQQIGHAVDDTREIVPSGYFLPLLALARDHLFSKINMLMENPRDENFSASLESIHSLFYSRLFQILCSHLREGSPTHRYSVSFPEPFVQFEFS